MDAGRTLSVKGLLLLAPPLPPMNEIGGETSRGTLDSENVPAEAEL